MTFIWINVKVFQAMQKLFIVYSTFYFILMLLKY
jgi:hypothetical protein